jgi:hypothetical protein
MAIIDETFDRLHGMPCWKVEWEPALGLKLSFGAPQLRVREPHASDSSSDLVRRLASYRTVSLRGEWWLWVWVGRWHVELRDAPPVTASSSRRRIGQSLAFLDGQRLVDVAIRSTDGATTLRFDLGGAVRIQGSFSEDGEMWSLYKPGGYVLSVRSNGQFSHGRVTQTQRHWLAIPQRMQHSGSPNKALQTDVTPRLRSRSHR